MYTIVYFSPTGNVKYIAELLKQDLNNEKVQVLALEKNEPSTLNENENLILIYAIHGFNAPRTVVRFINNLPKGKFKKVSLIGVGCNTTWLNSASSMKIKNILHKKAYQIYTNELIAMPLTFIMSFPDELAQKLVSNSPDFVKEISKKIIEEQKNDIKPPFKSKVISYLGRGEQFAARLFGLELHAKKTCTSCGICWSNCPEKNISPNKKNKPKFGFSCLMCMRCIYNCPENAITPYFSKFIPIKKGYSLNKFLK
ncbi:MAG: EFR1 family ferrodoxin [Bacteroidales bacterium]|nr:EFR1 family ferrodoxin [Bacteroidales bacterium]